MLPGGRARNFMCSWDDNPPELHACTIAMRCIVWYSLTGYLAIPQAILEGKAPILALLKAQSANLGTI